jgi:hypothetical protein
VLKSRVPPLKLILYHIFLRILEDVGLYIIINPNNDICLEEQEAEGG